MRLLWDNKVDSAVLTANSEETNYPVSNITHIHLSRKWRSTGDDAEWIKADMGAAINVDAVAVIGHNISSGANVYIQANTTDSWASPPVSIVLPWHEGIMWYFWSTSQSYRWWRIHIADSSNPDGFIEIGRLFLCTYYQVEKSFQKTFIEEKINTDELSYSLTGQLYADTRIEYKRYTLTFPYWKNSVKQAIEVMVTTIGKHKPIVLFLDEDNTDKLLPLYCHIEKDISYSHIHNYTWQGEMIFMEVF